MTRFFFQAEDGIRDADVTGVQTCALPIYEAVQIAAGAIDPRRVTKPLAGHFEKAGVTPRRHVVEIRTADAATYTLGQELEIGRASCRERVWNSGGEG